MKQVKINLQAVLKYFDTNVNQLATSIKERPDTIIRLRDNKSVRLTKTVLEKICTYFQINLDDLLNFEDQLKTEFNTVPLYENEKFILKCNLKMILYRRNITLEQAADKLDENFEIIRRMANDIMERYPIRLIEKILNTFDLTVSDLFSLQIVKDSQPSIEIKHRLETKFKTANISITPNLKQLLQDRNITLKKLSKDTGLSYQTLLRFQQNQMKRYPKDMLEILCTYLDVTLDQLFISNRSNDNKK